MFRELTQGKLHYLTSGLIALILAFLGLQTWQSYRLAADLREVARELDQLSHADPLELDLSEATALVRRARSDAAGLRARMRWVSPLTNHLGWLPGVGPSLAAAGPLLDYVCGLMTAADEILTGLEPLLEPGRAPATGSGAFSQRLLETLVAARPNLITADEALRSAAQARSEFELEHVPSSLRAPLAKADGLFPLTQQAVQALLALPAVLGEEGSRTYLLLAQNRDERRATGGFISGVGTAVIDKGRILSLQIADSYAFDDPSKPYPLPPEPLQRYMGASIWLVRDANWSPDFPTTAWYARQLFHLSTDQPLDGVVAFDQSALVRLLSATGPVVVASVPEPIGAANLEAYMREAWASASGGELSQEWWENRKAFMSELGVAIVDQVQGAASRDLLLELAKAAMDMVEQKHLFIQIDDPLVASTLADLGWDGRLDPGAGDFLMLVDSNVGFNKVDPKVDRELDYTVDLSDPLAPHASLKIRYSHTVAEKVPCEHHASYGEGTYAEMQRRCYWNYVRVMTPSGSGMIEGSLPPTPGEWLLRGSAELGVWSSADGEGGTTVFGGLLVLPTGDQAQLDLDYTLPASVVTKGPDGTLGYSLRLAKQGGDDGLRVRVALIPPQGYAAQDPQGWELLIDGSLRWEALLITDIELSVVFAQASR